VDDIIERYSPSFNSIRFTRALKEEPGMEIQKQRLMLVAEREHDDTCSIPTTSNNTDSDIGATRDLLLAGKGSA